MTEDKTPKKTLIYSTIDTITEIQVSLCPPSMVSPGKPSDRLTSDEIRRLGLSNDPNNPWKHLGVPDSAVSDKWIVSNQNVTDLRGGDRLETIQIDNDNSTTLTHPFHSRCLAPEDISQGPLAPMKQNGNPYVSSTDNGAIYQNTQNSVQNRKRQKF